MTTDASLPRLDPGADPALTKAAKNKPSSTGRPAASAAEVDRFDRFLREAAQGDRSQAGPRFEVRPGTQPMDLAITHQGTHRSVRQSPTGRSDIESLMDRRSEPAPSRADRGVRGDDNRADRLDRGDDRAVDRQTRPERRKADSSERTDDDLSDEAELRPEESATDTDDQTERVDEGQDSVAENGDGQGHDDDDVESEDQQRPDESADAESTDGVEAANELTEIVEIDTSTAEEVETDTGDDDSESDEGSESRVPDGANVAAVVVDAETAQPATEAEADAGAEVMVDGAENVEISDVVVEDATVVEAETTDGEVPDQSGSADQVEASVVSDDAVIETSSSADDAVGAGPVVTNAEADPSTGDAAADGQQPTNTENRGGNRAGQEAVGSRSADQVARPELATEQPVVAEADSTDEAGADTAVESVDTGAGSAAPDTNTGGRQQGEQPQSQPQAVAVARPTAGTEAAAASTSNEGVTQIGSTALGRAVAEAVASATGTNSADGADGDPIWQQIRRAIGSIRNLPTGERQMTIRLRPAELGAVLVRINTTDAGTTVALVTESTAAANQLNQQRQQLITDLEDGGLADVNVDIGSEADADRPGGEPSDDEASGGVAGGSIGSSGVADERDTVFDQRRSRGASTGLIDVDL